MQGLLSISKGKGECGKKLQIKSYLGKSSLCRSFTAELTRIKGNEKGERLLASPVSRFESSFRT
jgi:hypothetical protein